MNYEELVELIKQTLLKNQPLKAADLKSPAIDQVSNDVLPGGLIRLDINNERNPYEAEPNTQRIVVRGKGMDLPFSELESELTFYFINGEAALTWSASADEKWKLGSGFPSLQSTICDEIRFSSTSPPLIVLNSHSQTPGTQQGIVFTGRIDFNAMTGGLAKVLKLDEREISGPIVLKEKGSSLQKIDLTARPDISDIDLGILPQPLKLTFALNNLFIHNQRRKRDYVLPYILVGTKIPFTVKGKTDLIPISLRLVDLDSDQRFSADPIHLIDAGLDEIKSLANNIDLLSTFKFPDTFRIEEVLKFKEFFFDFNLKAKKVTLIGIGVVSARPWTVFHLEASQQDLIIESVGLTFRIVDPFGDNRKFALTLSGEVEFGKAAKDRAVLVFSARYPNWSIQAYLKEGTHLSLADTLHGFLGSTASVPDLSVYAFALELSSGSYAVMLDLEGAWFIPFGLNDVGVLIEQIGFSIKHQKLEGTDARAQARFRIAEFDINIEAAHPAGASDGWTFKGTAIAESDGILISQLLKQGINEIFPSASPQKSEGNELPSATSSSIPRMLDVAIMELGVDFNTQTKDFHFDTEINFGTKVKTILTFSNLHQAGADPPVFEKRATGVIRIPPSKTNESSPPAPPIEFDLGIDLKPESRHFVALYNNTGKRSINLSDLVKAMFPDASQEIPKLDINVKDIIVGYARDTQTDKTQVVFALDMEASIDLTSLGNIPLIGQSLSAAKALNLAFQLVYPTQPFAKADLAELNKLITVAGPRFPAEENLNNLFVKTELRIGDGEPIDLKLPVKPDNKTGELKQNSDNVPTPPGAQATDDGVKWFQLNKQFGPVHLQRAGLKFAEGQVTALLDGGLAALGLEVDLMGLSMACKITEVSKGTFKPVFGLQGLGLSFKKGGVGFVGALIHQHVERDGKSFDKYDGLASVEAEGLRLAAIGSLTKVNGQNSLFLYAVLDYPLGGAPFFYVTGLAGGFGLNQKLTMPPPDQVTTFPLVAAAKDPPAVPTEAGSAGEFIAKEMQQFDKYLTPSIGEYFACAGIRFTSFKLLDSFVLISISFGHEFELDLLGISTLIVPSELPAGQPALAQVTLQIVASFIPNEGIAIVQGRLTSDSHILDPNCHLTGGFAFATWFGTNANAGDFVITLGGYHPDFKKPDHYPSVPRVGINWQIIPELSVTGGMYFALTPHALMAGGAMRAIFQSSLDLEVAQVDVKAWFIMGADFIVYWKPFRYSAYLYIEIGIDVVIHFLGTHDLGFDVGADLQVWGPRFGGHAHVSITVIGIKIGFDVAFGASEPKPPPLIWDDDKDRSISFRQSFLPGDKEIVSVAISEGLVRKVEQEKSAGVTHPRAGAGPPVKKEVWHVINPKDFCVRTSSVIPIKQFVLGENSTLSNVDGNTNFGIASMDKCKDQVETFHQIIIKGPPEAGSPFVLRPIHAHVPGALWAPEKSDGINAKRLIEKAVTGFEIVPDKPPASGHTHRIERNLLKYNTHPMDNAYADSGISTFTRTKDDPRNDPVANQNIWNLIQREIHGNQTRDKMLAALGFAKTDLDIGEPFTTDAAYAPSYGSLNRTNAF